MKTSLFTTVKRNRRLGLTLVELMVVVSIMVMLVAISIPVFKPMLESQRTAGAARVVAGALQRTRVKAMQARTTYGLQFVRFEEGNAPNVALQLRLMRLRSSWATPDELRVVVIKGKIEVCAWDDSNQQWTWDLSNAKVVNNRKTWENNVQAGSLIQFGRQGRLYTLKGPLELDIPSGMSPLTLPDLDLSGSTSNWAVEAVVARPPMPAIAPQVVLPKGALVDLAFSGTPSKTFSGSGPVAVMFSPGGYVDGIMAGSSQNDEATNEIVYFCIGEWERQSLNAQGDTYAEDGRCNLLVTSNFWVTVAPRTGQVRITEFAAPSAATLAAWQADPSNANLNALISEVRKFASEQALNLGGF